MLIYPQLSSGALSQFPIVKRRSVRTVLNAAADGSSIKSGDPGAETIEWQLAYSGMSDEELSALAQFHAAMEGSLNEFTFLDPNGNLLAWSEDLKNAVWSADSYLSLSGASEDPWGGTNGWHIGNSGAGAQSLMQTLNTPGQYTYCFSVYGRGTQPTTVTLLFGTRRTERELNTTWGRVSISGQGDPAASAIVFGLEVPAGSAVDIFGPQVEAQQVASAYKTATTGGIFENARFRDDAFTFTTTDVNRHSATVSIIYAKHL